MKMGVFRTAAAAVCMLLLVLPSESNAGPIIGTIASALGTAAGKTLKEIIPDEVDVGGQGHFGASWDKPGGSRFAVGGSGSGNLGIRYDNGRDGGGNGGGVYGGNGYPGVGYDRDGYGGQGGGRGEVGYGGGRVPVGYEGQRGYGHGGNGGYDGQGGYVDEGYYAGQRID